MHLDLFAVLRWNDLFPFTARFSMFDHLVKLYDQKGNHLVTNCD